MIRIMKTYCEEWPGGKSPGFFVYISYVYFKDIAYYSRSLYYMNRKLIFMKKSGGIIISMSL